MTSVFHKTHDGNQRVVTQPFIVVGCLVERDGKFLMIRQNGKWNQPSGWLELGEKPADGAKREFEEETGLEVEVAALLGVYTLMKQKGDTFLHAVKFMFRGRLAGKSIATHENMEVGWLSREDIKNNPEGFWDPDVIHEVDDYIAGKSFALAAVDKVTRT